MASETPHYELSQDYERMLVLLETGPLLGFVDYGEGIRDTVCIRRFLVGGCRYDYSAGVRGIGYIDTWGNEAKEEFVEQCRKHHLSYIVPNAEDADAD